MFFKKLNEILEMKNFYSEKNTGCYLQQIRKYIRKKKTWKQSQNLFKIKQREKEIEKK